MPLSINSEAPTRRRRLSGYWNAEWGKYEKVLPLSDISILMTILFVKVCGYVVGVRGKYTITFHLFTDITSLYGTTLFRSFFSAYLGVF
jgi:hypothetical protein